MMIFFHIVANILTLLFAFLNVNFIIQKQNRDTIDRKVKNYFWISVLLGGITYLTYIILLVKFFSKDGFDRQSLSLLILSWAFLYAANLILKSKKKSK